MARLKITNNENRREISPLLYGIFFEDINYGGDGGLYGELIPNRSFEYYDSDGMVDKSKMCWETVDRTEFEIKTDNPINNVHIHYAVISGCGIRNTGWCGEGFCVKPGDSFDFSCYAAAEKPVKLVARIKDGEVVLGKAEFTVDTNEWKKYELSIAAEGESETAVLEIILPEGGRVRLDFISLFNHDTFMGRRNGMRRDIAESIAELHPRFMRFPGGCIVEGRSFENMYNWKDTIGPVEERRTNWNRWQKEEYQQDGRNSADYFQSYGLGFYEYFQFCEDIGAKPVPVINCGMTCQWHEGLLTPMDELDRWIQDAVDLIEFANGSADTVWGAKRAEMGHHEPFGMEYLAIGNEQWGDVYFERYEAFERVLSEKHPEIKLVTSAGWRSEGDDFDLAYRWMSNNRDKAYAVDEHFYKAPEWFFDNISRYDNYDRTLPKVFIGEYAAHSAREIIERRNTWECALSEAAFMTGVEENSDHVIMAAYAPLLAKVNHTQWQPNLIWFSNTEVIKTYSSRVQSLFAANLGDYLIDTECDDSDLKITASVTDGGELIIKIVNISDKNKVLEIDAEGFSKQFTGHILESGNEEKNEPAEITHTINIDKPVPISGRSIVVMRG